MRPAAQMHHRCARGMGGSSAAWVDTASNGLHVCGTNADGCHGRATETHIRASRLAGIVVPRGLAEQKGGCAAIPFQDANGDWWLIDDEGHKTPGEEI